MLPQLELLEILRRRDLGHDAPPLRQEFPRLSCSLLCGRVGTECAHDRVSMLDAHP